MKTKNLFLIGLFALVIWSCVTSHVAFNNNPDYHNKIKTAFVEVKDVRIERFLDGLSQSLITNLKNDDISIKLSVNDALSLNSEKDIQKQIQDFNPDVIIILERADSKMIHGKSGYSYDGGTYLMSIILPENNKIVWKASILTSKEQGNIGGFNVAISQTVEQIISKMKTYQLL
jgi:hypothetical protein